jgi:predicted ATPase
MNKTIKEKFEDIFMISDAYLSGKISYEIWNLVVDKVEEEVMNKTIDEVGRKIMYELDNCERLLKEDDV